MFRHQLRMLIGVLLIGGQLALQLATSRQAGAEASRLARVDLYAGIQVAAVDIGPSAIINPPTTGYYGKRMRAHLADDAGRPIAGVRVAFHIGDSDTNPTPFCVAVSNGAGDAVCTATTAQFARLAAARTIEARVEDAVWFGRAFNQFVCAVDCSQL